MKALLGVLVATAIVAGPESALAQRQTPPAQRLGTNQRRLDSAVGRARLEMEVRRNFARLVRQQVGLTDGQMRRLVPVTQRYEQQRRQLQMEERQARQSLRGIMMGSQAADSAQVDRLLQRLLEIDRRRLQIRESEQRDLSAFMSPMQRARFMALQEQMRRRLEQMRQRRP